MAKKKSSYTAAKKAYNARPEQKKRRAELNKARREKGIYGNNNGDKHISHTSKGHAKVEDATKNMKRDKKGSKKYASGKGTKMTPLRAKAGRPPKKSTTKKKK